MYDTKAQRSFKFWDVLLNIRPRHDNGLILRKNHFNFQPSSSSFCQAWVSLQTKLNFSIGLAHKKVCVCVLVLSQKFLLLLRNGHTSKMLLSFHSPFFHSSSLSISTTEESRIVKQKKKWKLFLISTCELFFTFFYVVSFSPTHKLSRSSLRLIFVNETRKKLEK